MNKPTETTRQSIDNPCSYFDALDSIAKHSGSVKDFGGDGRTAFVHRCVAPSTFEIFCSPHAEFSEGSSFLGCPYGDERNDAQHHGNNRPGQDAAAGQCKGLFNAVLKPTSSQARDRAASLVRASGSYPKCTMQTRIVSSNWLRKFRRFSSAVSNWTTKGRTGGWPPQHFQREVSKRADIIRALQTSMLHGRNCIPAVMTLLRGSCALTISIRERRVVSALPTACCRYKTPKTGASRSNDAANFVARQTINLMSSTRGQIKTIVFLSRAIASGTLHKPLLHGLADNAGGAS